MLRAEGLCPTGEGCRSRSTVTLRSNFIFEGPQNNDDFPGNAGRHAWTTFASTSNLDTNTVRQNSIPRRGHSGAHLCCW